MGTKNLSKREFDSTLELDGLERSFLFYSD